MIFFRVQVQCSLELVMPFGSEFQFSSIRELKLFVDRVVHISVSNSPYHVCCKSNMINVVMINNHHIIS